MSIAEFSNLYPSLDVDPELVNIEWQSLCEFFPLEKYASYELTNFWYMVEKTKNGIGEPMFKNLMVVVKFLLILPHSSAAAERLFSQLALIKSKTKNRLQLLTCSALLTIKDAIKNKIIKYESLSMKEIVIANNEDFENNISELTEMLDNQEIEEEDQDYI